MKMSRKQRKVWKQKIGLSARYQWADHVCTTIFDQLQASDVRHPVRHSAGLVAHDVYKMKNPKDLNSVIRRAILTLQEK